MWDCFKECVSKVLPSAGYLEIVILVAGLVAIVASGGTLTVPLILAVAGAAVVGGTAGVLLTCLLGCLAR